MHMYSGVSLYMPIYIYIEIQSPVSTWCTTDWETGADYAGSNKYNNEHNSSQIDWLGKNSETVKWYSTLSCILYVNNKTGKSSNSMVIDPS